MHPKDRFYDLRCAYLDLRWGFMREAWPLVRLIRRVLDWIGNDR